MKTRLALLLALSLPAISAKASGWNAVDDFYAGTTAPQGNPWTYGFGDGGASFAPDTTASLCYGTVDYNCHFNGENYQRVGLYSGDDISGASASTSNGIYAAPDALFLHPGASDHQSSVVRFTADAAGTYSVGATFEALDFYAADGVIAKVYHNGDLAFSQLLSGSVATQSGPGGSVSFLSTFAAGAGDTFDFVVDKNGSYYDDSTGLKAAVSLVAAPVPEPGEWAMMVAGLAVVGSLARRRRSVPEGRGDPRG